MPISGGQAATLAAHADEMLKVIVHTNAYNHLQGVTKPYLKPLFCCSVLPHQNKAAELSLCKFFY